MKILTSEIEVGVVEALKSAEATVRTHASPAGHRAQERVAFRGNSLWQVVSGGLCGLGVFYGINGAFLCGEREWFWPGLILLLISLAATALLLSAKHLRRRAGLNPTLATGLEYDAERLNDLLPHARFSPAEQHYVNALILLLKPELSMGEGERQALRARMQQLMEDYRALKTHAIQMEAAFQGKSAEQLTAECERLDREIAATTDSPTADALKQTRRMLEQQAEHERQSDPTRRRLTAQIQAVEQTLSTLHASLARLHAAPAELAASSLTDLNTLVSDVTQQTRSVEQAVQEVATLRIGR